jgi:hypothetical protein
VESVVYIQLGSYPGPCDSGLSIQVGTWPLLLVCSEDDFDDRCVCV